MLPVTSTSTASLLVLLLDSNPLVVRGRVELTSKFLFSPMDMTSLDRMLMITTAKRAVPTFCPSLLV